MPECPVCNEEFKTSGIHPHLRSHEKGELASVVAQVAKSSSQPSVDATLTEGETWHQMKAHKTKIAHERNERNQKVKQHLESLDQQIKETLQ